MPHPAQDPYGDTLKLVQIIFYGTGTVLAVLTYLAAKRGLLNTVNTEYQKRVMDRLAKLSEDLYSEFDPSSPTHWARYRVVEKAIDHINDVFERNMDEILAEGRYDFGVPATEDTLRLGSLLHPIISDPFIPNNIRAAVIDLLQNRLEVMNSIYFDEFEKYTKNLAKGKRQPITTLEERNAMHNKIIKMMNDQGCGISQIEEEVHNIRRLIQEYFNAFNPHRRWWKKP